MADLFVEPNPVPSSPEGLYFNYNLTDSDYGPEAWGDLDTRDSPMKEFTNRSGWGTWKGHLAERDPTKNRCEYREKQSPLDLYQTQGVQEAKCDAPHQIRSRVRTLLSLLRTYLSTRHTYSAGPVNRQTHFFAFSFIHTRDLQPATFRLSSDKVTKLILPHKLSLVMNRRNCRDPDQGLCSRGRPPMADYPRYSSGLSQFSDLLNFDIKIPGEHWIEGEQFDAEIQMLHTHLDSSRVSSIGVPIRATADGFNAEFQSILDQFQLVYNWDRGACDTKDLIGPQAENSTTPVLDPDLNRRLQESEPMFNPYSDAIMTTVFFYKYDGTTTEPPCTYLTWWVMSSPMIISREQLHQAKHLLFTHVNRDCEKTSVHNRDMSVARPLQKQADDQYIQKCKEGDFEADGPATRF